MSFECLDDSNWINMSSKEIQKFLCQLWVAVSDPRNRYAVRWVKEGRVFRIIDDKEFDELCEKIFPTSDRNYFNYFVKNCGFERIPPLDTDFHHRDFLQHDITRIKNIQPKQTVYTPPAYYSYLVETPYHEVPFILDSFLNIEYFDISESENRAESRESKETSEQDFIDLEDIGTWDGFGFGFSDNLQNAFKQDMEDLQFINSSKETSKKKNEIDDNLKVDKNFKETFTLDFDKHSPSEDQSLGSTSSIPVNDSFSTGPAISDATLKSLYSTPPSKVDSTKNDYEADLATNVSECTLEETDSSSSSSTLTSGTNSPNASASPTNSKSMDSPNVPPSKDDK